MRQKHVERDASSEELAYLLLEEARLRCKLLLGGEGDAVDPDPDGLSLGGLYSDLGIAGYYASARLEPARRRQLLAEAHVRSTRQSDRPDLVAAGPNLATAGTDLVAAGSVRALADVIADAIRTVERALTITGLIDHMHLAHIHVMSACEALDSMFALPA